MRKPYLPEQYVDPLERAIETTILESTAAGRSLLEDVREHIRTWCGVEVPQDPSLLARRRQVLAYHLNKTIDVSSFSTSDWSSRFELLGESSSMRNTYPRVPEVEVEPLKVRFTQASISPSFRNGISFDQTIDDIVAGRVNVNDLPKLELVMYSDGHMYSLSNRRLFVFRVLQVMGKIDRLHGILYPLSSERVQRRKIDDENGLETSKWERSFSTRNGGRSVHVNSRYRHDQE